jgi:beta-glucanase (GH16 family)
MWPYTYDTCDVGTFPNQTMHDGTPAANANSGARGGPLSFLPGQRVSACTCPGSDHPGPNERVGRGVPEVDIIEAQVDLSARRGQASQSNQIAPFSAFYNFDNSSTGSPIYDPTQTSFNNYKGGVFQQAVSAVSYLNNADYAGNSFQTYGYELWSDPSHRDQGYITWSIGNQKTWTLHASAIGPDADTGVQQRLIAEEPMV